ncbi:hypothetical protein ACQB6R_09975 [Propionibacteriaceae bacterium G1746]|uniref:hypothetical protein n=1 Tax=Aestuariimicrobium sp. G57 TaxID=3418485 RepID=UPI003C1CA1DC
MLDMPAPQVISWQNLEVATGPRGDIESVTDQVSGEVLLAHLRIEMAEPWQPGDADVLAAEVELSWAHPSGATAVLRHVFDETWTIRLTLVNRTDAEARVPAPRLRFQAPWPTRRWIAGGEASIGIDPGRAEQLVLTQLQGQAHVVDGQVVLTPDPLVLPAQSATGGPGQFQVSWRGAWLADHVHAARVLPAWWPDRVGLAEGQEVVLSLPDAALTTSAGVTLTQQDEDTWIAGPPGKRLVQVHNRLGTTDMVLWWGEGIERAQQRESARIVEVTDPRTCEPWEAWIVTRSAALLGSAEVDDYLRTAVEERCARSGPVHPLDVMAVCAWLADKPGEADVWDELDDLVARMPTQPGSQLALVHARLLAMQHRRASTSLRSRRAPARGLSRVEDAMCQVEAGLLHPADEPDELAWRVAGLLGAGLPGETVGLVRLAQVYTLTALYPEHWDFTRRWPTSLAEAREVVQHKLVASALAAAGSQPDACEAFGWLLAGV